MTASQFNRLRLATLERAHSIEPLKSRRLGLSCGSLGIEVTDAGKT